MDSLTVPRRKKARNLPAWKRRAIKLRKKLVRLIAAYNARHGDNAAQITQTRAIAELLPTEVKPKATCMACLKDKDIDLCKLSNGRSLPSGYICNECLQRDAYERARENHDDYYARRLLATPVWADFDAIEAIYEKAREVTRTTGVAHHVDHIVPLRSEHVCGLHIAANLQILTASENCRKGNRFSTGSR